VLTPETAARIGAAPTAPRERLVVRRVLVPDYLDTTDILLRDGPHEVQASTTARWAERLSAGLTSALTADLAALLPPDSIVLETSSRAQRQLLVNVEALDLWPDGRCVLAATWSIVEHAALRAPASGTGSGTFAASSPALMTAEAPGSGSGADARRVESIARVVAELADRIAVQARHSPELSGLRDD
jgi:uncharacterized lipoprotein YmbA